MSQGATRTKASRGGGARRSRPEPRRGLFVGIGASAGALEALERFFAHVPADSGLAFIVVQHLERHHPSVLAQLLAKHTRMPVTQAEEGARARPDHVYVIPPNAVLTLDRGVLRVTPPAATGLRTPVDAFLRSLAQDQAEAAVGIILSGTGSDGTSGLRAIREHGGLTLAQAPATARYEGMPESAIAAGLVDAALPVEAMPARLLAYARHLGGLQRRAAERLDAAITAQLRPICAELLRRTGHDFSRYKERTLVRRVGRRVRIQDATSVRGYLRRLKQDPGEAEALVRDLAIGVTHFFRDAETFAALEQRCLPEILGDQAAGAPARIWVPGCASGEEAYSIAILVREHLARHPAARPAQIFATDIDAELVAAARQGRYSDDLREHVAPERLARFFVRAESSFQVTKELRDMCTFSVHSLIKDPPFSALDLVSCRNLLIYLGLELQRKLAPLFHFALRPGGYLLLGPAEDLVGHDELFARVDPAHRLFRRTGVATRPPQLPLTGRLVVPGAPPTLQPEPAPPPQPPVLSQALERLIRDDYAPPCVVVNERAEVLYLAGPTSRYLQPREGVPSNSLLDQVPAGLRLELRTALAAAATSHRAVVRRDVRLGPAAAGGAARRLCLTVRPLPGVPAETGLYAVVLQEPAADEERAAEGGEAAAPERERDRLVIAQLEDELRTSRADLQASAEELRTSNEELKSANEELTSTNEELQSANEELQSAREEMQTINDELREKVAALDAAQSELQSHYAGSQIATIFLDRDLRIARFTPAATVLFHLIDGDVGRPISDLAPRVRHEALLADARGVLQTQQALERHVRGADGQTWFLMRMLPARPRDRASAGVGITFVDVTNLLRAEEAERRYGELLKLSPDAVFVWSLEDGIETWNRAATALYGYGADEARGRRPHELLRRVPAGLLAELEAALRDHGSWDGDLVHQAQDGRPLTVAARLRALRGDDGVVRVLETDRDITAAREIEARLAWLASFPERNPNPIVEVDQAGSVTYLNAAARRLFPALPELQLAHPWLADWAAVVAASASAGAPHERIVAVGDDHYRQVISVAEDSAHWRVYGADVTSLVRAEQELAGSHRELEAFLAVLSHELRNPLAPICNSLALLEEGPLDAPAAARARGVIRRQAGHLVRLVNDLLDLSRVAHGKIQLERQPCDLGDLAARTLDDHREELAAQGIDCHFAPPAAPLWLDADPTRLAQIIGNLLDNARKFTPAGGRVEVGVDAAGDQAELSVRDTGEGMTAALQGRVFTPFVQGERSLARSRGGLGLGLPLVKAIVELHGGTVAARSHGPGRGTEITVRLPLGQPARAAEAPGPAAPAGAPAGRPLRLLIVEDNADAGDSLRDVLALAGHEVVVARTGPAGVAAARAAPPDVILCDIGLPEMDGYAVARELRADPQLAACRLVALTGYAQTEDLRRATAAGFDHHLAKPPALDELKQLLAAVPPAPPGPRAAPPRRRRGSGGRAR